ncbi:MAG: response regulator [Planctomycetota bacterium]
MKKEKILLIEDEPDILDVLEYNLRREGYRVVKSRDGEEGLRLAKREGPDLVLLDLMLPGLDGIEVCRSLKSDPVTQPIPVIMVTAKGEESDVVLGLGVGADDYVSKPFSPKELIARVKAVLRRGPVRDQGGTRKRIELPMLTVDPERHEVLVEGEPVSLTPTEIRLLHFLASHPGRVFDRGHIMSRIIGEDAIVIDRNVDVHVRAVRQKLGRHRDLIETVRGVGYRFKDLRSGSVPPTI